ncbi:PAS domain S-box protein [bacterium]|nr:PAS domain S-box protein [bacterium]
MLFFLIKQPDKKAPIKALIVFLVIAFFWGVLEILAPFGFFNPSVDIILWRLTFFVSSLMILSIFWTVLAVVFKKLYYWLFIFVSPIYIFLFYLTVLSDKTVKSMIPNKELWEVSYNTGDMFTLVSSLIALPLFSAILLALVKYFKINDKNDKKRLFYILIGMFFPASIGVTTNLILPALGKESFRLANVSGIVMIFFVYYSINKYGAYGGKTKRYSIGTKLSASFVLVSFLAAMAGAAFFYKVFNDFLQDRMKSNLSVVVKERSLRISHFLKDQREKIEYLANSPGLEISFLEATSTSRQLSREFLNKRNFFRDSMFEHFYEIFVLNKDGLIVDSTNVNNIGLNRFSDLYFTEGKKGIYIKDVYQSQTTGRNSFVVSAPIKNSKTEEFMGVIAGRVEIVELDFITTSLTGLDKTGETYLINKNGYIISGARFEKNVFLKEKVDTVNSQKCFAQKYKADEIDVADYYFGFFKDYRDVDVFGTYSYIPDMEWCLLAEVGKAEIFNFYNNRLKNFYLLGFLIILLISIVFGYIFSRFITGPILELGDEIKKAVEKKFNYEVKIKSRDEVGALGKNFNLLLKEVVKSREEIDIKVEEQIKEIREKKKEVDDQQKAILNVLEDVSEEKDKTSEEKDKIKTILYSIGDGVFVLDENYKIIIFNKMAGKISGYSEEEAIGKRYDEVFSFIDEKKREDRSGFIEGPMKHGRTQEMRLDTILITKQGESVPVADSAAPIKDKNGKVKGCVVVFRDVTKEREIDKAKTEFVSLASHQLRTPLSSINWYAEMLMNGDAGKLNEEQLEFLGEIYKGNQRMVDLVNALLNVSRIELGTLAVNPEPLNFRDMSESVLNELKYQIKEKKLKISKNYNKNIPKINADPSLIRIIFQNFLTNSVKYTPESGKIGVKIKIKGKNLLMEFSDSGYGIPKKQQNKIFSKLFRADNVREKDSQGTGLGLYIVKSIIDQANGKVWFKSAKNKGTTFYVEFPLRGMKKKEGSRTLNPAK